MSEHFETSDLPHLGYQVVYRSKIDNGPGNDVLTPAIVTRTVATTVEAVAERWGLEPRTGAVITDTTTVEVLARPEGYKARLDSVMHVDLVCFGVGQTYREYNVAYGLERGQWCWPWDAKS